MKTYGTLCDYKTGKSIRPATEQEWRASREAEAGNIGGGTGVIVVDGQSVYVEGGEQIYSDYTAQFSEEPSYYGSDCTEEFARQIVHRLMAMVAEEFPGIQTRVWRDGDESSSTLGPDESVCDEINQWIEDNWTKAI